MTDKELFLKYNNVRTDGMAKDENLAMKLYNNEIKCKPNEVFHKLLILLHATYKCNADCIYCENGGLRKKYGNKVMSKETLKNVIEKLGPEIREITWHGGEPLTLPEDLISYLEELKKEYNYKFTTSLQTNSILLTDEKVKFLDDLGINWGTSFDGIDNTTSRGKASTDAILSLIDRYPKRIGFISVRYTDTIDKIIENYEYYKTLNINDSIQSCVIREIVLDDENPLLVKNEIAIKRVIEYMGYWIHDTNNPINDSFLARQVERVLGTTHLCEDGFCIGGWLIVDPEGNIGFCGHAADDGYIGNINEFKSGKDLLYSKKYLQCLGKQIKLEKTCSDCIWYNVCHGACMGLNYEWDHSYNTINPRNCEFQYGVLDGTYELIKNIDMTKKDSYNPYFIQILNRCNYYSLDECKKIEEGLSNNG